ncbi:MAG: serine/threonine protein kinase, partial [Deltaproteobacteria bacterium]|nr:serine/threonine protein kinase [Deltaproteobacteria bacterium]
MQSDHGEFEGTARFEVRRRLGAGGMGVVYEVIDRERNTRVALKTLRHARPQDLYRFKNEFRALRDLEHRNLVSLGELIEEEGEWFFTMELVRGCDLLSYVRSGPVAQGSPPTTPGTPTSLQARESEPPDSRLLDMPAGEGDFDEDRLCDAFAQLAQGLGVLHAAGKVHRDIKPSNILVTDDGRVVLLDFGLLKETAEDRQSTDVHIVGTAAYMAPEQATGKGVGPPADWYGVGVILFVALTGQLPFDGPPIEVFMAKQQRDAPRPSALVPTVPEALDALCVELLQRDSAKRPTGDEVMRRLG